MTQRILGIKFAHVILTAEADSLSTDAKELLEDDGSSRSNDLSVLAGIDSTGYVRLLWESSEEDDKNTHAAILQLRRQKEQSQIRESEQLIRCSMTSNRLHWTLKVPILMTLRALCPIRYTKGEATGDQIRRWHTLRCCVCHLHHEQVMKAPYRVRQFFNTVIQQVHHFMVDVIAGDANAAAFRFYRNQEYQDLHNSSVSITLRETQHEVNMGHPFESRLNIDD